MPMKVMTVLGTRPEIIRLSRIMKLLDQLAEHHILVHTGQNFSAALSDIFFEEMELRAPDYRLPPHQVSIGSQLSILFQEMERIITIEKPDRILLLGDTNSALSAIIAERLGVPVIHMEAGNRCFDHRVPEEMNRRVIDAISSLNLPYTEQSKRNLLREGIPSQRIVVTGNPIYEVLQHYKGRIDASGILQRLKLEAKQYMLMTAHRAENVDHIPRLTSIMEAMNAAAERFGMRIICSIHPRTRARIATLDYPKHPLVEWHEPFGFMDFVKLEKHAFCVVTDSGTVQEECCLFRVPTVTIRDTTERPETVDCGSNIVSGLRVERIVGSIAAITALPAEWSYPSGYMEPHVSSTVVKILLGGNIHV